MPMQCSARTPLVATMQADNWDRAEQHEIREEDAGGKWDDDDLQDDSDAGGTATADAGIDDAASVSLPQNNAHFAMGSTRQRQRLVTSQVYALQAT